LTSRNGTLLSSYTILYRPATNVDRRISECGTNLFFSPRGRRHLHKQTMSCCKKLYVETDPDRQLLTYLASDLLPRVCVGTWRRKEP
jgi:hypothetical protein